MASEQIPMIALDVEVFKGIVNALSDEEIQIILHSKRITDSMLETELERRDQIRTSMLQKVYDLCNSISADMSRTELNATIYAIKRTIGR